MKHVRKIEQVLKSLSPRDRFIALDVALRRAGAAAVEAENNLREALEDAADDE